MSTAFDPRILELLSTTSQKLASEYVQWVIAEKGRRESEVERNTGGTLRDSIRYRARAVVFHLNLLDVIFEAALRTHQSTPDRRFARNLLEDASLQLQFTFDDLVFNIISLFDYIGCFIGLVAEGIGSHQIDWRKAVGKAKGTPLHPATVEVIVVADKSFVSSMLRYRSEITHFRRDDVDGHITTDLLGKGGDTLHITVPKWFASSVAAKAGIAAESELITDVSHVVTREAITTAATVLKSLCGHMETVGFSSPPQTADMMVSRWSRAGLWERIAADPRLSIYGVGHVGGGSSGFQVWPMPSFVDGRQVQVSPIDVRPMLGKEVPVEVMVEIMVDRILAELS